jgi:hypothetical protein
MNNELTGIIFSYDRAMQLDGLLRSFYLHCLDPHLVELTVLYKVSDEHNQAQYLTLIHDYPQVSFVLQNNFYTDVIDLLTKRTSNQSSNSRSSLISFVYHFSTKYNRLRIFDTRFVQWLLSKLLVKNYSYRYILFLVDDAIFTYDFSLQSVITQLQNHPKALGFSLRLGKNTTYCYSLQTNQVLPEFESVSEKILKFNWTTAELDFNYPLEVSSSMYRTKHILQLLFGEPFGNPNGFEGVIASQASQFLKTSPNLLCLENSVAFCNPINMVQKEIKNRAGTSISYSAQSLSQFFDDGKRIDVKAYNQFIANGCHQEVDLKFIILKSLN